MRLANKVIHNIALKVRNHALWTKRIELVGVTQPIDVHQVYDVMRQTMRLPAIKSDDTFERIHSVILDL